MKSVIVIVFSLILSSIVSAQSADSLQAEAMKKLDWLIGEWKGEALTQIGPINRDTVLMQETIKKDLNGTIILIEGLGHKKVSTNPEEIVHHAFAVISYDEKAQKYRWQSWRVPGGYYNQHEPIITHNGFSWNMETPRGKMRYTMILNEKGEWQEIGEFSRDGINWQKFFSMLLKRVN